MQGVEARRLVRELYRGVDGFSLSRADDIRVRASRSNPTYGEVMPTATLHLLEWLDLGPRDVFYDLGSGLGKVVLMAGLVTRARRCVGIELATSRVEEARRAIAIAERRRLISRGRCTIRNENILTTDLHDATVLYTCSTAFPTPFMHKLQRRLAALGRPLRFATLQELDPHPAFTRIDVVHLDMTWRRKAKVHLYRVVG